MSRIIFLFVFCLGYFLSNAQEKITPKIPDKWVYKTSKQVKKIENKINKKSEKALSKFLKLESKLNQKLMKKDSLAAKSIFKDSNIIYIELTERLQNNKQKGTYIPSVDSLVTAIKFLKEYQQVEEAKQKLSKALDQVKGLEREFQKAEDLKQFFKERKQFLHDKLNELGFVQELKKLNKQTYYFATQIKEYKDALKDQNKAERKAFELLSKTNFFDDFMRKNSILANLFSLPKGNELNSQNDQLQVSLSGLQTRAQIDNTIQQHLSANDNNAEIQFQQNIQTAYRKLDNLKEKVLQIPALQGNSGDIEIPDFKPNTQKTKTFVQRLELGINIQTQKSNEFFPVTSNLGVSAGYKLNDKSVIGVGVSYIMGWGTGWHDIHTTYRGLRLSSYADIKLKGSFWISGGYEMYFRNEIKSIEQLKKYNAWQNSGLIGLSKTISIKGKFFKKTKIQVLWDFFSYRQIPRTQPIVYRINFNFK